MVIIILPCYWSLGSAYGITVSWGCDEDRILLYAAGGTCSAMNFSSQPSETWYRALYPADAPDLAFVRTLSIFLQVVVVPSPVWSLCCHSPSRRKCNLHHCTLYAVPAALLQWH